MKILSIGTDQELLDPASGGAARMRSYASLVERYEIVVASPKSGTVILSENSSNCRVTGSGGATRPGQFWRLLCESLRIAREMQPDVITSQDPFETALVASIVARRTSAKLNIQEHGDFFSAPYWRRERLLHFFRYWLGAFMLQRADSIRVVGKRIARTLEEKFHIQADKIVTVPVYVNLPASGDREIRSKISPAPVNLQSRFPHAFIFLTMARLVPQKNISLLLRALKKTHAARPETMLAIIGKGPERKKLELLAAALGLGKSVVFEDWTADPKAYYQSANAYVLSSDYEGWGRVIVEAAAEKLPIVMTDAGCAGELIENEKNGLVVPIGDEAALAEAMIRIAENAELRARLGEAAHASLSSLPTHEQTLELYKQSWEKALEWGK